MIGLRPDIEFRRHLGKGVYRSWFILYWKPFRLWMFGKTLIGKKY